MERLQISERKPEAFFEERESRKGDAVRVSESTVHYT